MSWVGFLRFAPFNPTYMNINFICLNCQKGTSRHLYRFDSFLFPKNKSSIVASSTSWINCRDYGPIIILRWWRREKEWQKEQLLFFHVIWLLATTRSPFRYKLTLWMLLLWSANKSPSLKFTEPNILLPSRPCISTYITSELWKKNSSFLFAQTMIINLLSTLCDDDETLRKKRH